MHDGTRRRIMRSGLALMVLAPFVSAGRAAIALGPWDEPGSYWILFAVGGSTSALGTILLAVATWRSRALPWVVAGAMVAGIGHYALPRTDLAIAGPSLVQLGSGIIVTPWQRLGSAGGVVAAAGAWLRHPWPVPGNLLLLVGTLLLATAFIMALREPSKGYMAPPE